MSDQITVIRPSSRMTFADFRELWQYRELLCTFILRDVKLKYRQTYIGVSWALVQPLFTMIVFSFFFGKLAKMPSDGVPYPIFSYAGLILWVYFSGALANASNSMISNGNLISKVYFPRIIIPLSGTLNGLVDYFISAVLLLCLMLYFETPFTWGLLLLPLILVITWLLASGVGLWLGAINVRYRDVRYIIPFFLQLLMYISPIIYPASVAERFRIILILNPLTGLVEAHRAAVLGLPIPWAALSLSVIITAILFVVGVYYFKRIERQFADII